MAALLLAMVPFLKPTAGLRLVGQHIQKVEALLGIPHILNLAVLSDVTRTLLMDLREDTILLREGGLL